MAARVLIALCLAAAALADSPLTSVDLTAGYKTAPLVATPTMPVAEFATQVTALKEMGHLAAAVGSVGWENKQRGTEILGALSAQAATNANLPKTYGFLLARGFLHGLVNYLDDAEVMKGLEDVNRAYAAFEAERKKPSLAIYTVKTLLEAQTDMAKDWCAIAAKADKIKAALGDPKFVQDVRKEQIDAAFEYLALYRSPKCGAAKAPAEKRQKNVICTKWTEAIVRGERRTKGFYWNIKVGAEIVLTSEAYASSYNAQRGLYDLLRTAHAFACNKVAPGNQKGEWQLTFVGKNVVANKQNTKVVATGERYTTKRDCTRGGQAATESIRILAAKTPLNDNGAAVYNTCGPRQ